MECKACSVLTGPGSRLASMTEGVVSVREHPAEPKTELLCVDKPGKQRRPFSALQFRFFYFFIFAETCTAIPDLLTEGCAMAPLSLSFSRSVTQVFTYVQGTSSQHPKVHYYSVQLDGQSKQECYTFLLMLFY